MRCAVDDFDLRQGIMHIDALVLDTEVTTIVGTGSYCAQPGPYLSRKSRPWASLLRAKPLHSGNEFAGSQLSSPAAIRRNVLARSR